MRYLAAWVLTVLGTGITVFASSGVLKGVGFAVAALAAGWLALRGFREDKGLVDLEKRHDTLRRDHEAEQVFMANHVRTVSHNLTSLGNSMMVQDRRIDQESRYRDWLQSPEGQGMLIAAAKDPGMPEPTLEYYVARYESN